MEKWYRYDIYDSLGYKTLLSLSEIIYAAPSLQVHRFPHGPWNVWQGNPRYRFTLGVIQHQFVFRAVNDWPEALNETSSCEQWLQRFSPQPSAYLPVNRRLPWWGNVRSCLQLWLCSGPIWQKGVVESIKHQRNKRKLYQVLGGCGQVVW